MSAGSTIEDFQRDMQERRTSTPGDEERKQRILDNGLECLRRLHGDQTWEDWMGAGAALMIVTEEASAEVGASRWDKDNKRLVREFNRRWEEYEARLRSNYKPLTKQERWALREVMTNAEIGIWRGQLDGPEKRKLNHPNAVVNRWKASTRTHEPRQMRQPSPALKPVTKPVTEPVTKPAGHDHAALVQELAQAKARIAELEKAGAGENARLQARIRELEDKLALAEIASGRVPKTVEELVARRRVAEEIRKAERAAAKAARQAQAPAPEPEETIASLSEKLKQAQQQLKGYQTRVRNLNAHNRAVASGKGIRMSKPLFRQIQKYLHPDKAMSDPKEFKRLNELSQEFNSFKILSPDD